jgi:hypothetical protein
MSIDGPIAAKSATSRLEEAELFDPVEPAARAPIRNDAAWRACCSSGQAVTILTKATSEIIKICQMIGMAKYIALS